MPDRLQLSRRKGYRLPLAAKSVARPSRWGNPFTVAGAVESGFAEGTEDARGFVVEVFRDWITRGERSDWWFTDGADRHRYMTGHLSELTGRDLACYCPPGSICHADVLLELANQPEQETP